MKKNSLFVCVCVCIGVKRTSIFVKSFTKVYAGLNIVETQVTEHEELTQ